MPELLKPEQAAAIVDGMMTFGSRIFAMILILLATVMLAGCASSGIPQDGRYQTHGGGWDNWRG